MSAASVTAAAEWTEERVEQLKALWNEGLSASQVANEMACGFTRNAIVGKVHRLKLVRQSNGTATFSAGVRARKAKAHGNRNQPKVQNIVARVEARREAPGIDPFDVEDNLDGVDVTSLIGILELTEHTCKFPYGDPREPGFGFCGKHSLKGSPYCEEHTTRAWAGFGIGAKP